MKFSHSQRVLHPEHGFTPPPNYYNLAHEKTKILTGSLIGPSTVKEIPRFGQASRFNNKAEALPGPGAYFKGKQQQRVSQKVKNGKIIRQYKQHGYLGGQERSPSIPYSQLQLDQEDQQQFKQILINQDPNKSALLLKKKHEGYTFPKSPRQFNKQSNKKVEENPLSSIAEYAGQVQRRNRVQFRQQIKRTNQRRAEIINLMNPEFVPSLQLIQIISKRRTKYTPGPGSYNGFKDQPKLIEPGASFPSSKRFSEQKISQIGPGMYSPLEEKVKSISISKSSRNLYDMKNDTDLQHRFYIDPYLHIKKRQDNKVKGQSQPHPFGSQVVRFQKIQKDVYRTQDSYKQKKQSRIQQAVELRLQKLNQYQKRHTAESQGLLGLSTMASSID